MKSSIILFFTVIIFSIVQSQSYTEIKEGGWGEGRDFVRPCFTDLDNDGLYDLIIGDRDGSLEHLEQSAPGSSSFISLTKNFNNINLGTSSDPAPRIMDIDNDGLLDLLIGNYSGTLLHYEQAEPECAAFILLSDSFNDIDVGKISTPSFTDIDHDGLIDLIVGEEDGYLNHFEQDTENSYSFTHITDSLSNINIGKISTPCFTDFDNDGLLDLVVGENLHRLHYFEQNSPGSAVFDSVRSNYCNIDFVQPCPVFVDFNNNGLIDLMIGDIYGYVRHYEQQSTHSDSFVVQTINVLPGFDFGDSPYPFLLDIDKNDRLDLIIGANAITLQHLEQVAHGSNLFTVVTDTFSNIVTKKGYSCPAILDLDNNGLLDLVIGNSVGYLKHYEQDADSNMMFIEVPETFDNIDVGDFSTPCFADLDNNGLLDLLVGNGSGSICHFEQSAIHSLDFDLQTESFSNIDLPYMVKPCMTDLYNDGRLDLIIGNSSGNLYHYEQDTVNHSQFLLIKESFAGIHIGNDSKPIFGDVNGDGLDDILIGEEDGGILYFQRDKETGVAIQKTAKVSQPVFELRSNYPNPFNPVTLITYYMHAKAEIELSILDTAGKRIETLFHGLAEPGEYQIAWNASGYAAGYYLIKLSSNEHHRTRRCLFLK